MKIRRVAVLSLGLAFVAVGSFVGFSVWNNSRLMYPTPEMESVFLKKYSPEPVIKRFECKNQSSSSGQHSGSGAGRDYVTHSAGFQFWFVTRPEMFAPLTSALVDDASYQLRALGATEIGREKDAQGNYRVEYILGRSIGSITIFPVTTAPAGAIHRATALPAGLTGC